MFPFPDTDYKGKYGLANFRKGSSNEWKSIFTPEQKIKAAKLIPEDIIEHFQWV